MEETARRQRNFVRLGELHPVVRRKVAAIVSDLEGHGWRPRIQCAWRSPADQLAAFQGGYSKVKFGFHNVTAGNGTHEALAADILDDDHPLEEPAPFLAHLRSSARAHGMEAPFSWDACHVQICGITIAQARRGLRPA